MNEQTLRINIRNKINELKADQTTGMSRRNMKQIVSTTGLTCSPAKFHELFDEITHEPEFDNFLYE